MRLMRLGPIEINLARPRPPDGEIGGTGTSMTPSAGGVGTAILTEEDYNKDLQGGKLYDEIDRMRLSDSQVKAALSVIKLPLLASAWHIEPASEEELDVRIAAWLEQQLLEGGMMRPWAWTLRHILLHLDFGTMPFETVWEIKDDSEFRQPLAHLVDLAPRMPRTITEWRLDDHGRLAGIVQNISTATEFKEVTIPVEKLLVFVNEQEGANYKGTSVLRAARKDWLLKERVQKINAIALEKRTAGIDVGTLIGTGQSDQKKRDAENVLATVRAHERAFVVETDDFKYRVQGIEGTVLDPLPTIQYHDLMILRGVLAEFLAMGTGGGSLAMHRDKSSFFLMALGAIAGQVTSTINRDLIPAWVKFNWANVEAMPTLTHSRLDRRDVVAVAEGLAKLIPSGAITPDEGIEAELRDMFEMPEIVEDDEDLEARRLWVGASNGNNVRARAPRTKAEKIPDFIAMTNGLDKAENRIVSLYGPVQVRQIEKLVDEAMKAIEKGDPDRLERINVPFRDEAAKAFSEPLVTLFRQGQTEVRKELAKMKMGSTIKLASPLDPTDDDGVQRWLNSRSRAIANALAERLRGSMLRHGLDMIKRGDVDRSSLVARLTALSSRDIKREAAGSTSEALNIGRESVANQNKDLIKAVEYSAIMDDGTCGPCGSLDGTTFELGSPAAQRANPPYRECSGFANPRCRCVFIYTLESESVTRG